VKHFLTKTNNAQKHRAKTQGSMITCLHLSFLLALAHRAAGAGCDEWPAAKTFCNGPASNFEPGVGYPEAKTKAGPATTSEKECCCACAADRTCNGWTLNGAKKTCYLKQDAGPSFAVKSKTAVSGLMPTRPPQPPYKPLYPTPKGAKNVLFLAVDDMRPSLGAYNFTIPGQPTHSPNIDKLASEGTLFTHAYVQYAYCSPSRNSFMSGRRPDTTKVWEFADTFREVGVGAEWVTMPEYFKQFGYLTMGAGKLYHPSSATENIGMDFMDWPASWSPEYPYYFPKDSPGETNCTAQGPFPLPPGSPPHEHFVWCAMDIDKDDNITFGQQVRDNCVHDLVLAAQRKHPKDNGNEAGTGAGTGSADRNADLERPFFIGCGFHKPHAPYYAPKEFFDRLPHYSEIPLPEDPFAPVGMPVVAWHPYADVAGMGETPAFNGTVNMTRLQVYRRAYYASISYTDYNIGMILSKLEELGLKESTITVVFGDHGYQLGEHATWSKMTNFELGVHIPLVVRVPWLAGSIGKETAVLAEMVDIYPTLATLAGLPDPRTIRGSEGINGTSLAPAIADPSDTSLKTAAFSQFSKNNIGTGVACRFFRNQTKLMGYTIRTRDWRYTAWFPFNGTNARGPYRTGTEPDFFGKVVVKESLGRELYDHRNDSGKWLDWPGENVNLVNYSEHSATVRDLHQQLLDYIQIK
jgi:arylsulfatase A-like enzyme